LTTYPHQDYAQQMASPTSGAGACAPNLVLRPSTARAGDLPPAAKLHRAVLMPATASGAKATAHGHKQGVEAAAAATGFPVTLLDTPGNPLPNALVALLGEGEQANPAATERGPNGRYQVMLQQKVETDIAYITECLADVLGDLDIDPRLLTANPFVQDFSDKTVVSDKEMQVLSFSLVLLNMIEENARVQIRRKINQDGHSLKGTFTARLDALEKMGITKPEIEAIFADVNAEIVLTAHPTEARRHDFIKQLRELYVLMVKREKLHEYAPPQEVQEVKDDITAKISDLWNTGEFYTTKPKTESERERGMYFLKVRLPEVVRALDRKLQYDFGQKGIDIKRTEGPDGQMRFTVASWIGGDRDGHSGITAEFTATTLQMMRDTAIELQTEELARLEEQLTQSNLGEKVGKPPAFLARRIIEMAADVDPETSRIILRDHHRKPWKQFVALMQAKMPTPDSTAVRGRQYQHASEVLADLAILRKSLIEKGQSRAVAAHVYPVERSLQIFGFHLGKLDLREDSRYYEKAMVQVLEASGIPDAADYSSWDTDRKLAFLSEQLETRTTLGEMASGKLELPADATEARNILAWMRVAKEYAESYGYDGLGPLIVSNTYNASDILEVYFFAKEAGLTYVKSGEHHLEQLVVPLYEEGESAANSEATSDRFLAEPIVQRSHDIFIAMLSYSDLTKDSAPLASWWYRDKVIRGQIRAAARAGKPLGLFHGRGGPFTRGGGPTNHLLNSLPPESIQGGAPVRTTEQGEVVIQNWSNPLTGLFNAEQWLAGAMFFAAAGERIPDHDEDFVAIMDDLADWSRDFYIEELIRQDGYFDFFGFVTPEVSVFANRGSRAAVRAKTVATDPLKRIRMIEWTSCWSQARFYTPGLFAFGFAICKLHDEDKPRFDRFIKMARKHPGFLNTVFGIEANLESASHEMMDLYGTLIPDDQAALKEKFMRIIKEEMARCRRALDLVFEDIPFRERRPFMAYTIGLRDQYLRLAHLYQVDRLRKWRALDAAGGIYFAGTEDSSNPQFTAEAEALYFQIVQSMTAISHGERNTG
jgi:phosphoenolpyruvate carboxylase